MRRVPLRCRGVVITTAPSGYLVAEASKKPIDEIALTGATLNPQKVWAAVAVTKELLDFSRPGALELFREELRRAAARATDAALLGATLCSDNANGEQWGDIC
jgi:HK97 family phage major capsid protein